ncbi:MAG TPA: lysine 2,3-aminomutase, partial [Kribbella sp.]
KNYRTGIEQQDPEALNRTYEYYDPIDTLPAEGQGWWKQHAGDSIAKAAAQAAASRDAAESQKLLQIS